MRSAIRVQIEGAPMNCPKCGSEMQYSDEYAGIKTPPIMWCPQCGHEEKVKEVEKP